MIVTEIYNGQGLGNQLFCYVTTRSIAKDKGYEFGIMNPHKFKCLDFMNIDFGVEVIGGSGPEGGPPIDLPKGITSYYVENRLDNKILGCDIRELDSGLMSVSDYTKIDGVMQSEDYFIHNQLYIKEWISLKEEFEYFEFSNDDICIINLRGGEYRGIKDLFLKQKYWDNSVSKMREINPNFRFIVITDDIQCGKQMFPNFEVYHFNIGKDYSIVKNAHYLILSNSSFAFFPTWTSQTIKYVIAPKYWARHNIGIWSCGYNLYRNWNWMDRDGEIFTYDECIKEKCIKEKNNNE
jgi:hypothetical protein